MENDGNTITDATDIRVLSKTRSQAVARIADRTATQQTI